MIPPDAQSPTDTQNDEKPVTTPQPGAQPPEAPQPESGAQDAPSISEAPGTQGTDAHSITLRDLHAYYGDQQAIKGVDLDFAAGQVTGLIGPSGCGKSTLVRCINRMHEEIPGAYAKGSVKLDELDVYSSGVDVTAVRRLIGMVFQKPNPFPTMSIFDNVAAGLRLTGTRGETYAKPCTARSGQSGYGERSRTVSTSPASDSPGDSSSGCASPGRSPSNRR